MRSGYKGLSEIIPVGMGKRLDELCQKKDVNYKQLRLDLGMSRYVVQNILEFEECHLSDIVKIANYFGVSLDWLVFGKEKK